MTMPAQTPGRSRQDYGTPPQLLAAVEGRLLRAFTFDLAATRENAIAPRFYSLEEGEDALERPWAKAVDSDWDGLGWLNPPFADLEPWVQKARYEAGLGLHLAMLVPSAVGANWWRDCVEPYAYTLHLNGRVTFVGETTPYPKDCSVLLYLPERLTGSQVWTWR